VKFEIRCAFKKYGLKPTGELFDRAYATSPSTTGGTAQSHFCLFPWLYRFAFRGHAESWLDRGRGARAETTTSTSAPMLGECLWHSTTVDSQREAPRRRWRDTQRRQPAVACAAAPEAEPDAITPRCRCRTTVAYASICRAFHDVNGYVDRNAEATANVTQEPTVTQAIVTPPPQSSRSPLDQPGRVALEPGLKLADGDELLAPPAHPAEFRRDVLAEEIVAHTERVTPSSRM
jgi:hypothetical protein